jgi:Flp pilus assembly secretin CpaC
LGRDGYFRGSARINVSSCNYEVTLHGSVRDAGEREKIEAVVRAVPGVRGVTNRLRPGAGDHPGAVSERAFRGI